MVVSDFEHHGCMDCPRNNRYIIDQLVVKYVHGFNIKNSLEE